MFDIKIPAVKIKPSAGEYHRAAGVLVPLMRTIWPREYWQVRGFSYSSAEPEVARLAIHADEDAEVDESCYWTTSKGLDTLCKTLLADWSQIVGVEKIVDGYPLLPDLVDRNYVMLCCIDSAHWICTTSDKEALYAFVARLPYSAELIDVRLSTRGNWGL